MKEALTILFSFFIGYGIDGLWARTQRGIHLQKKDYHKFIISKNIRIHHNWVGYIFIIIGLFWYTLLLVPAGLGIIVGHKIRDRLFWFIEFTEKEIKSTSKKTTKEIKKIEREKERKTSKNHKKIKGNIKRKF